MPSLQNNVLIMSLDGTHDPELENVAQSRGWMLLTRPSNKDAMKHVMVHRPRAVIIQMAASTDSALELIQQIQTHWLRPILIVAVAKHSDQFERDTRTFGATCYLPGHKWIDQVDSLVGTTPPQKHQPNDRFTPVALTNGGSNFGESLMTRPKTHAFLLLITAAVLALSNTAMAKVTLPSNVFAPDENASLPSEPSSGGAGSDTPIIALNDNAILLPVPSPGMVKLKLTNAEGFFAPMNGGDLDGDVDLEQRPRAPLSTTSPGEVGDEFLVAYRVTSFNSNGGTDLLLPDGKALVGLLTYLQISEVEPIIFGSTVLGSRIGLTDSSRDHNTAAPLPGSSAKSIGRFYLFEADTDQGLQAGVFDATGGRPDDVDFSNGFGDVGHTVTDGSGREFLTDILANFADPSMRLVIAASIQADESLDDDGEVDEIFEILINNDKPGLAFDGLLTNVNLIVDGGDWFSSIPNPKQAGFEIKIHGYDGTVNNYIENGVALKGDRGVFDAGWQATSEDPIEFYVPEPSTLLLLAMGGIMIGRRRPRRQAAA